MHRLPHRRPASAIHAALALVLLLAACASVPRPAPLQLDDVVAMSRQGVPEDEIIQRLKDSHAVFNLSWSRLAALREQGVPVRVIDYLEASAREAERRRAFQDGAGAYPWGPYPLGWWPGGARWRR